MELETSITKTTTANKSDDNLSNENEIEATDQKNEVDKVENGAKPKTNTTTTTSNTTTTTKTETVRETVIAATNVQSEILKSTTTSITDKTETAMPTTNKIQTATTTTTEIAETATTPTTSELAESQQKKDADIETPPPIKRLKLKDSNNSIDETTTTTTTTPSTVSNSELGANLRKFKKIPIFIVDYHNDVLEFIYRCLATRHLPLENNVLVHFDSHPDMVISREIPASASFDKETMLAELGIENWIMPACYVGHFKRVIWLKNSWCKQMPNGKYNFKVGHKNNQICVDCPLEYFISEGNFCATNELESARDMELHVINADTTAVQPTEFLSEKNVDNFILDIDLDFFSTSNPFLEIYKDANCYEQLTEIFHFETAEDDCAGATEKRKQQLEVLKQIFEYLEETRSFDGLPPIDTEIVSETIFMKIKSLAQSLQKYYADDEIDWLLIYDSGSTTDTNGLPHHISNEEELKRYFGLFKEFLLRLPVPPVLITMACSAEDDYCPKHQVADIQENVLNILREVFGDKLHREPVLHYLDEEWDVMQL